MNLEKLYQWANGPQYVLMPVCQCLLGGLELLYRGWL